MASDMGMMEVQVPAGTAAGQVVQATSPEGQLVQVTVPQGTNPGSTLKVQYPLPRKFNLSDYWREFLIIALLLFIACLLTHGIQAPVDTAANLFGMCIHYGILIVIACACVYYDWNIFGPTIALQHGAIAVAVAWLIVVPLWPVTQTIFGPLFYLGFIGIGILLAVAAFVFLGPLGCIVGAVAIVFTIYLSAFAENLMNGTLGNAAVFLATYFIVRKLIGFKSPEPSHWPYVTEVQRDTQEFREQSKCFVDGCTAWAHKYDFDLTIEKLYRIDRPGPVRPRAVPSRTPESTRRLFHGTQWEYAKAIIVDGFRLPNHAGMFGKGVYFADCPLKSWRYCFATKQLSELIPRTTGRGGLIIQCAVELGTMKEAKEAQPELSGYNRRSWSAWWSGGRGAYDSVVGVTEESGGALRVPEYVVYDTDQVRFCYMFEVKQQRRTQPGRHERWDEQRGRSPQPEQPNNNHR